MKPSENSQKRETATKYSMIYVPVFVFHTIEVLVQRYLEKSPVEVVEMEDGKAAMNVCVVGNCGLDKSTLIQDICEGNSVAMIHYGTKLYRLIAENPNATL